MIVLFKLWLTVTLSWLWSLAVCSDCWSVTSWREFRQAVIAIMCCRPPSPAYGEAVCVVYGNCSSNVLQKELMQ